MCYNVYSEGKEKPPREQNYSCDVATERGKIMEIVNNLITIVDTGSVELNSDVEYVKHQCALGRKASHEVARCLLKIKREELFTVCADSFSDFCANYFGINKATGSKLTSLAERFLFDENGNENNSYDDFSISQLMEIRNASPEEVAMIKPTMTVKEIRDILHPKKAIEDKSNEPNNTNNTNENSGCDIAINTPNTSNLDPEKSRAMIERVEGNETTPTRYVGQGFDITMTDKNEPHQAHIYSFDGLKNFYDYMTCTFTPETIENNVKVNVVIDL